MNRKNTSLLLAWTIVWASITPAVPAFAASMQMEPAGLVSGARVAPGAPNNMALPPALPPSAVTSGVAIPGADVGASAAAVGAAAVEGGAPAAQTLGAAAVLDGVASNSMSPLAVAPSAAPKSLLGRLGSAVAAKLSWSKVFDAASQSAVPAGAMALRPLGKPTNLPEGFDLGEAPTTPKPGEGGVEINAFDFGDGAPRARTAGDIFSAGPRVLKADPTSEKDVERALREFVDSGSLGLASQDLQTVHVKRVPGKDDQADTIYAYFRQQKQSANVDGSVQAVAIQGSYLSFTVKVVKDQPTLMAAMARVYPSIDVDTTARAADDRLKQHAIEVLNVPQNAGIELVFSQRTIVFHKGRWKTVNLYDIEGLMKAGKKVPVGVKVAVDVATGEVFAWDARHGLRAAAPAILPTSATGVVKGRAEAHEARPNGKPQISELTLPHLDATVGGKAVKTDAEGKFTSPVGDPQSDFKASLSGTWAVVNDMDRNPLSISASVKPGENVIVANPTQNDLKTLNQVNMYIWISRIHDWWSTRLHGDARIDKQLPVNVNIDDECNAYYTPGRPSLNFFQESANCSDTGRPGVGAHEYGHFVDDMIGGIVDGGLSEGWGDIGSMFLLGSPVIGDGFLKGRNPSYIRHGENKYQYSASDEVHDQGQAWMGFGWKLRKALVAKMGDEAKGAAEAEALIVPTLFAKAHDIPAQMAQVLLNAMDKDGAIKHEKEIRDAAKAHGIKLPANPRGVVDLMAGAGLTSVNVEQRNASAVERTMSVLSFGFLEAKPKLVLSGNSAKVLQLRKDIETWMQYRHEQHGDLAYRVAGFKTSGTFGAELSLEITGSPESVEHFTEQIRRMAGLPASQAPARAKPAFPGPMTIRAGDFEDAAASKLDPALADVLNSAVPVNVEITLAPSRTEGNEQALTVLLQASGARFERVGDAIRVTGIQGRLLRGLSKEPAVAYIKPQTDSARPSPSAGGAAETEKKTFLSGLSRQSWAIAKGAAALAAYLAALKYVPEEHLKQVSSQMGTALIFNWLFGGFKDSRLDAVAFVAVVGAFLVIPLIAPAAMVAQALGTVGTAYLLALLFLR